MSALTDKIAMTSRNIFLLGGILLGAGYYFANQDQLGAQDQQLATVSQELKTRETEIAEASKVAGDKKKFEEEVDRVSQQLRAAVEFLPTRLNQQDILAQISKEARAAGVNPTTVQPKKPNPKGFYEEFLMDVEMEGSYVQMVSFLAFMSKIQRIVNIRGLELRVKEQVDDIPILKMKGTFVAYRYVEGQ